MLKGLQQAIQDSMLTKRDFAFAAGISEQYLYGLLRGRDCTVETLVRLAKVANKTTDFIVYGEESKSKRTTKPKIQ